MSTTFRWQLPMDSTAPAAARWHLREIATSDLEAVDAELVVTELVSNAWKHGCGDGPIQVGVEILDESLLIEVCGESKGEPIRADAANESSAGGRGLLMIEELVTEWGYRTNGAEICVWAKVPRL